MYPLHTKLRDVLPQHGFKSSVKPFYHTIALQMVSSGVKFLRS